MVKNSAIVGVYCNGDLPSFTKFGQGIDEQCNGRLMETLLSGGSLKSGKCRILYGLTKEYPIIAAVGLGVNRPSIVEERDETKENIRVAVGAGCSALTDIEVNQITVDPCDDSKAAGEAAALSSYSWEEGIIYGNGQNIARKLMETPANIMTPTRFAQEAVDYLESLGITVNVRTKEWIMEHNMNSFLSVSKGSEEPPIFLDLTYQGISDSDKPLALVGKGITFDSGGISLKSSKDMGKMKADMGGAACIIAVLYIVASLKIPIYLKGFLPLCENLPSGKANKPGDVVFASNGKSIEIDNTDAEGRLILADALHYASLYSPKAIIDMATLTGAMVIALGSGGTGIFTNSDDLWTVMHKAGHDTGDRVWRMPLWKHYSQQVTDFGVADVHNIGKCPGSGGSCTAAAFLQEFVTCEKWMHMDIAGVMENEGEISYISEGMSGRPSRTVAKFVSLFAQDV